MLEYLEEYIKPRISVAMEKLKKPVASVAFDDLWLLFKPGLDVYFRVSMEHFSSMVWASVVMETEPYESEGEKGELKVMIWTLESDGGTIGREWSNRIIPWYEGERQVTSLPICPCKYLDSEDGGKTRQTLINRGHKAYKMLREMPKQMWYDGYIYTKGKQVVSHLNIIPSNSS